MFFFGIIGFSPYWNYKSYDEYFGQIVIKLSTTDKIHLKCDCIDGFVLNGVKLPLLFLVLV